MTRLSPAQQAEANFRPNTPVPTPLVDVAAAVGLEPADVHPSGMNTQVTGVSLNTKTVLPDDLYLALPGAKQHGAAYGSQAIAAGAAAILTDPAGADLLRGVEVPVLSVQRPRQYVGAVAELIYRDESVRDIKLFGVTGTNGKTTTSYFIDAVLTQLGLTSALVGTIETRLGAETIPSSLTTPEATQLHALFAKLAQTGGQSGVMEVSSHAISYQRISGLHFAVAGFTNLTQDHLDLHGSMADYFDTKAELFSSQRCDTAVILTDGGEQGYGHKMAAAVSAKLVRLCTDGTDPEADWSVTEVTPDGLGHAFTLQHKDGTRIQTSTGLPGEFNIANAALAAVMVLSADLSALGITRQELVEVLSGGRPFDTAVPGRMEVITQEPAGVVDFAHNPDAMIRTLSALKEASAGKLILVFGATGERDTSKRAIMGAIAAEYADVIIVSDDDPHGEEPAGIRAQVMAGAKDWIREHDADRTLLEISPRQDAIKHAAELADRHDTIVLAGRGHETAMDVAGTVVPIDDRDELRHAVALAQKQARAR
ncbi:UDP-N-acetylmuramoyl-L-alanyl-D-glutamate--2,6-diaminopimelate ligase [Micrococcoides hystricis]|uniref:UDP-N-acetylmuramyl-tripeptide synthetase n=1 Tax=Micrococcoides hystricis TaxID=1572761 RepID=A0ABV6P6R3_9MICC